MTSKPSSSFEIELKALLTKDQYERLRRELPHTMRVVDEDVVHTIRYRPGNVRLRFSGKMQEFVTKSGDPTKICSKEIVIPLESREQLDAFAESLAVLNFKPDPSWITHKQEFETQHKGRIYLISLQHIEKFAYILEVEIMCDTDESDKHELALRSIIKSLVCEPIDPRDFSDRIKQYIKENKDT